MQESKKTKGEKNKQNKWFRSQGPWANAWSMENHPPDDDLEDQSRRNGREPGASTASPPATGSE